MLLLGFIIHKYYIHFQFLPFFFFNFQIYFSVDSNDTAQLGAIQACLPDVKNWLSQKFLKINLYTLEAIIIPVDSDSSSGYVFSQLGPSYFLFFFFFVTGLASEYITELLNTYELYCSQRLYA